MPAGNLECLKPWDMHAYQTFTECVIMRYELERESHIILLLILDCSMNVRGCLRITNIRSKQTSCSTQIAAHVPKLIVLLCANRGEIKGITFFGLKEIHSQNDYWQVSLLLWIRTRKCQCCVSPPQKKKTQTVCYLIIAFHSRCCDSASAPLSLG